MAEKDNSLLQVIWDEFVSGDKEAFATLYNLHVEALFRYGTKLCCDREMVKDALQEIFIDVFLNRSRMKITPGHLRYYLLLALKRNLIKKMESERRPLPREEKERCFEVTYSIETSIIDHEEEAERNRRVAELLNTLPAGQKEALYLRYNEAMEYSQIAEILHISVESVRKQVYRALSSIREKWGNTLALGWIPTLLLPW